MQGDTLDRIMAKAKEVKPFDLTGDRLGGVKLEEEKWLKKSGHGAFLPPASPTKAGGSSETLVQNFVQAVSLERLERRLEKLEEALGRRLALGQLGEFDGDT